MCGTYFICNVSNCKYEGESEEDILSHLYIRHKVEWWDGLKLTCCEKNTGLQGDYYKVEFKCKGVTSGTFITE